MQEKGNVIIDSVEEHLYYFQEKIGEHLLHFQEEK